MTLNLVGILGSYCKYYKLCDNQYPLVAKITYFCNHNYDGGESNDVLQPNDIVVAIQPT
jgi:hypothetical protein